MEQKSVKRIIANVYETSDYSMFRKMRANRAVTEGRVGKILASFSEKEILNPIVINEKYEIVDGQGRYEACKRLGRPIKYIIAEGATVDDCRRMNRYNERWTVNEWVDSYSQNEDPEVAGNYIRFKNVHEELKIPYARILRIVNKAMARGIMSDAIQTGQLVFREDDEQKARYVYDIANEILAALCATARTNEAFWTAVKVMTDFENYNHKRMLENCKLNRGTYTQMSNLENQLKEFSRIYNFKRQKERLYFDEYMRNRGYHVRTYDDSMPNMDDGEDISTLSA